MRNKLKKIWNKEDGFTLVELLGVIVILGLIVALAIPAIGNVVSKARVDTAAAQKELVIDAAQMYVIDGNELKQNKITSTELIAAGYLEDKKDLSGYTVTVTKEGKKEKYTADKTSVAPPAANPSK